MASRKQINIGGVKIGGGAPISVQTMTNSDTEDVDATIKQIDRATVAGCDIIRVSCPTVESTLALRNIIKRSAIPVIADIHFNYKRAIEAMDAGAHCIRINPGNTPHDGITEIVKAAKYNGTAIRIGINSGSIEKEILDIYGEPTPAAMVESAILNCKKLEDLGFLNFKVSVKSSDVKDSISSYRLLSQAIDYPLHVGITESGTTFSGTIKSSIGIGALLADGIGDTIRVSLAGDICDEIKVGRQILKSLNLLQNSVNIIACPTCARTQLDVINIAAALELHCEQIQKQLKISILGCVVNGIGEAIHSDIGIFGFKDGTSKIYLRGREIQTCKNDAVMEIVKGLIDEF